MPVLPPERAEAGIEVDRIALQVFQGLNIARSGIDSLNNGTKQELGLQVLRPRQICKRIQEDIHDTAESVAQRGGAEERQDQIGPLADPVGAEGLAEVLLVVLVAFLARDVEKTQSAAGGVDGEAGQGGLRAFPFTLQQIVDEIPLSERTYPRS